MSSKEYFTAKDLSQIVGINEGTLRTYLCHYSLAPHLVEKRDRYVYKLKKTKEAINAFISYVEIRSRIRLDASVKKELRKEVE